MKDKLYLSCQCNSEVLTLEKGDGNVYLTIYTYAAERFSFWERVKILFGGKVRTADVVLSTEDFEKIKQF